jgi:hypothetical protein
MCPKDRAFSAKLVKGLAVALAGIALIGQTYATLHPGYENILLEPDPVIGWKFAPDIEFVHTGDHWYANERSVRHKTNSHGFTGPERPLNKPPETGRIALMGDSFVEALQVPWEQSAAGVLECGLNRSAASGSMPFQRYEVLNFAVSNLSLGQYLLIWEAYASKFSPDYVFVFVAQEPLERTPQRKADWGVRIDRPSFDLVQGRLIRYPVQDYKESRDAFRREIERRGGRIRRREQRIWVADWIQSGDMSRLLKGLIPQRLRLALKQLVAGENTVKPFLPALKERLARGFRPAQDQGETANPGKVEGAEASRRLEISEEVLEVNLLILEELNQKVSQAGATLVVVDASLYFWFLGANALLTERIHQFSLDQGIAYLPLYKPLLESDRNNLWVRFPHSHHFNEHGNAVFAREMLVWMSKNPGQDFPKKVVV